MARFTAVIVEEDGIFVAHCPELGTVSQGSSQDEALANLKEATQLYLEEFPEYTKTRTVATFEVSGAQT